MRRLTRQAPVVHYFHQVDDPFSHLAVQKLDALRQRYALSIAVHLVSQPDAAFKGSEAHFDRWALRDALSIAADYGAELSVAAQPSSDAVRTAASHLVSHLDQPDFARAAFAVGRDLWAGASLPRTSSTEAGDTAVSKGNRLRHRLGHYQGAMFWFEGEWFWGVDRMRQLEARLIDEGFGTGGDSLCVPEPVPVDTTRLECSKVVLEYFPSLRSPFTAVGHARVLELVERSSASLQLRPVLPMMMRGVPAPFAKKVYIMVDAAREARAHGVAFGRIVDPFGEPVKRAFRLYMGAAEVGKGLAFVTAYLSAAWAEGIDITTEGGVRQVTDRAGLDWSELQRAAAKGDAERMLDTNLNEMLDAGLWGVPSFRVLGGDDAAPFACWGQDRIWRVENEIARRASGQPARAH